VKSDSNRHHRGLFAIADSDTLVWTEMAVASASIPSAWNSPAAPTT